MSIDRNRRTARVKKRRVWREGQWYEKVPCTARRVSHENRVVETSESLVVISFPLDNSNATMYYVYTTARSACFSFFLRYHSSGEAASRTGRRTSNYCHVRIDSRLRVIHHQFSFFRSSANLVLTYWSSFLNAWHREWLEQRTIKARNHPHPSNLLCHYSHNAINDNEQSKLSMPFEYYRELLLSACYSRTRRYISRSKTIELRYRRRLIKCNQLIYTCVYVQLHAQAKLFSFLALGLIKYRPLTSCSGFFFLSWFLPIGYTLINSRNVFQFEVVAPW